MCPGVYKVHRGLIFLELDGFDIDSAIVQRHGRVYITTLTELFGTRYFVPGLVLEPRL